MTDEDRYCLECNRVLFGRSDKKFCNDSCRNTYNNRVNSNKPDIVKNVNSILGKNWRVLKELNPTGKVKSHRDQLLMRGFDFEYSTNSYTTKYGDTYKFCYDQGYLLLEDGVVLLVEKKSSTN